jgi:hypothetical protein
LICWNVGLDYYTLLDSSYSLPLHCDRADAAILMLFDARGREVLLAASTCSDAK